MLGRLGKLAHTLKVAMWVRWEDSRETSGITPGIGVR